MSRERYAFFRGFHNCPSRLTWRIGLLVFAQLMVLALLLPAVADDGLPEEPLQIGHGPQYVFDNYVIDNHWALKYKREAVQRMFHQPVKSPHNPVLADDGGFGSVTRDADSGQFRMWYQTWVAGPEGEPGDYAIAYAQSMDGIQWERPKLGLFDWQGSKQNNIVWTGTRGRRGSSPLLLDLPQSQRRGYRYVLLYRETDGIHVIGTHDGIHFERDSDQHLVHLHSDTANNIVYDPQRQRYLMYCRAKHIYRTFRGDVLDTGASRRVAVMTSPELWTQWTSQPQTILIPDELDARENFNFFYGMVVQHHGGVFWGYLWPFKMNTDIHTELAWSRDGIDFDRPPTRPKLIERGPEGSWDDGMVFGNHGLVEVGDEWWIYYAGWDGPHETRQRTPGIGLATIRKEGFISMHGPPGGGVVSTRAIHWMGNKLLVNATAMDGELKVRVTDERRKPLPGFDYTDCIPFHEDNLAHEIRWQGKSIGELKGQTIRLEFFLKNADLYTFRAEDSGP